MIVIIACGEEIKTNQKRERIQEIQSCWADEHSNKATNLENWYQIRNHMWNYFIGKLQSCLKDFGNGQKRRKKKSVQDIG